jgi:hypothetical protein
MFRIEESLTYPNASYLREKVFDVISATTADNLLSSDAANEGDRPWNDFTSGTLRHKHDATYTALLRPIIEQWTEENGVRDVRSPEPR